MNTLGVALDRLAIDLANSDGYLAAVPKAVVVHAGARDAYQVALALQETGQLQALVTDLYWPADRKWARQAADLLPKSLQELLRRRQTHMLSSSLVVNRWTSGLQCLLLEKLPYLPFSFRRRSIRALDAKLGHTAGMHALATQTGLVSYSYCGYDAMQTFGKPAMLFQAHPHPATMRRILRAELEAHPDCAESLNQEWELSLPKKDYEHLVEETRLASHFMVASSFTRASLVEQGIQPDKITVIPYGVDLDRFHPCVTPKRTTGPLRLLFVGRINQRKGIKYLLEALRDFRPEEVHLTVCGRVVDGLDLFNNVGSQVEIRSSVSDTELVKAYLDAELFVFPSVAEGFGQVLLEAMASGLPILSTNHTAAPDLIEDGVEGFIVEPRRPDALAERITWAIKHREEVSEMGRKARLRAEDFDWCRFRKQVAKAVAAHLAIHST
jgi:glycosyltransferase involved in cell wall biosynthesis